MPGVDSIIIVNGPSGKHPGFGYFHLENIILQNSANPVYQIATRKKNKFYLCHYIVKSRYFQIVSGCKRLMPRTGLQLVEINLSIVK